MTLSTFYKTKRIILLYALILWIHPLVAQATDTLRNHQTGKILSLEKRILDNKLYQITHIGAPLIVIGSLTSQTDRAFSNIRNSYIPSFRSHYDDYLQYAPGAIMLGLKAFGVEGRSSWGRILTSDAIAMGIVAATVNSLKAGIHKERPDRSGNNSFPSGHTATAFMMATMLHKEYGTTRSPLYSVLGYSLATATALSRQLNNKHWFSDVLTGAGIGIVSTELGYYLADLIFKEKGLIHRPQAWTLNTDEQLRAYLGIQMGYGIGNREVHLPEGIEIEGMAGATASLAGGWFFNHHWGVAGKFTISQVSPHLENNRFFNTHLESKPFIDAFETHAITYKTLLAGMEYNTRILPSLYLGGSMMGGVGWTGDYQVDIRYKNRENTSPLIISETRAVPIVDLTVYLMHVSKRNLGMKIFVNYNTGIGKASYTYYAPSPSTSILPVTGSHKVILHHLNIGAEVSALFWK